MERISHIIETLMFLCVLLCVHGKICTPGDTDKAGYFPLTADNLRVLYVRYGHYAYLPCCGDDVTWYKWSNSTSQWQSYRPYDDGSMSPSLEENSQILTFKSTEFRDEGLYKCKSKPNNGNEKERIFSLKITACDELARGPYPIAPLPCERTYTDLRATLTLPCAGYFGCGGVEMRAVKWYVREGADKKWKPAENLNSRYRVVTFSRINNTELGANLTISNVEADDFARDFMCLLTTPQMVHGQSEIHVRLVNKANKDKFHSSDIDLASVNLTVYLSVAAFVILFVVVVIIAMTIVSRTRKATKVPIRSSQYHRSTGDHVTPTFGKESQRLTSTGLEKDDV